MTASAARRLADVLDAAGRRGFADWSSALQGSLAAEVEIRHTPAVKELDGWRERQAAAAYLQEEVAVFPRAFAEDFDTVISSEVVRESTVVSTVTYLGTLLPAGPAVEVAVQVEIELSEEGVVKLQGSFLPTTGREEVIAWLKAVEGIGGFDPPAAQRA